jgi:putative drug exporter of the RND superfamily
MTGPLYRLGGFCTRHARVVFGAWIVFAVAIVLIANATGRPTSDDTTIPGSESTEATDLLAKDLPKIQNGSVPIVLEAKKGTLDKGDNKTAVENTVKKFQANPQVESLVDPLSQQGASSLSKDKTIGFISLFIKDGSGDLDDETANDIFDDADPARDAGLEVSAGSYLGSQLSSPSTKLSEIVGIVAAMIVLVLVLGTVLAMVMPITTAIVGVFSGLAVIGVAGAAISVPSIAPTLALMLGLGVGVDYSLFIVSRHLKQLEDGTDPHESVARAVATSGGAVVFAGSTVVISLLCLFFGGIPQVQQLGYSAAIGVAVVIVAALTLLPAGLGLLGNHINSVRVRTPAPADPDKTGWGRWAEGIGRHPILAALAGIVLLVVLSVPVFSIRLGAQDNGEMPTSTTIRQSYDTLTKGFGVGANGPFLIAVKLNPAAKPDTKSLNQMEQQQQQQQEAVEAGQAQPPSQQQQQQAQQQEAFLKSPASDPRLVALQNDIGKTKDVKSVSQQATLNKAGTAASFSVVPGSSPSAKRTQNLVNTLRDDVIPKSTKGSGLTAYVGGTTAANIDLASEIGDTLPLVIIIIVAISFLLLTLAFRTFVVPALAAASNLLAVAAAYGVLVAVFQKGWGITLIGLDNAIPIVSFVPLMMFAILFGLSTDYTVFLLTRVSEEFDSHGDHRRAIIEGLGRAARVIVAAATIMVLVFASFIISGNPTVKQFGVGLAVAVAVDALIVCLVLPALMLLVGKACWWMPGPIERHLPQLGIEGEKYFEERDAAAAAAPVK